jgi:DNA-directed RNA polymerase specialized sigma24 family protein
VTLGARDALLEYIANPRTQSSLRAYVRRRGLHDGDDLVQTALCDALAVEAVPVEDELPRWVTGITRHKVSDEFRRRARFRQVEPPEPSGSSDQEARDLLRRIDADVVDEEQRRTLEWLVREHAGESLDQIAREQALPPTTVRQRICRLRQKLRARYLWPLLAVLGLGSAAALLSKPPAATITIAERTPLDAYAGTWRVVDVAPIQYRELGLQVSISSRSIRVFGPTERIGRELVLEKVDAGRITLRSGASVWVAELEQIDGRHLRLTTPRGFVELEQVD